MLKHLVHYINNNNNNNDNNNNKKKNKNKNKNKKNKKKKVLFTDGLCHIMWGAPHIKGLGMLVVLLRGVSFGF